MLTGDVTTSASQASPSPLLGPGQPSAEGLSLVQHELRVKGKRMAVATWGRPGMPVVVLLHGLQSHAGLWDKLGQQLAARGCHVVAPDRRGHGHSDWFDSYYTLDYVADLSAVLDQVGGRPVTLVGHCESTIATILFAAAFPGRVGHLVLIQFPDLSRQVTSETRASLVSLFLQRSASSAERRHPVFASAEEAVVRLLRDAPFEVPPVMARRVTPRNTRPVEGGVTWRWDPAIVDHRLVFDLIDLDLICQAVAKVDAPITLLYGEDSVVLAAGDRQILQFSRKVMPRARPVIVRGGHYPHMEEVLGEDLLSVFRQD
jgi:pimeloyl-ACP methyl ester carboxylesterase